MEDALVRAPPGMVKFSGIMLVSRIKARHSAAMIDMEDIGGYHAHVYYDEPRFEQAKTLLETARDRFGLVMGNMHRKPVGPHPVWSCQLIVTAEQFGTVIPWLNIHRGGLTVFVHPLTDDDLYDHRDAAIWLGDSISLNLEMFLKDR